MSKLLIVAASLFCIVVGATVAYAQQCQKWRCSTIGGQTTCTCAY